MVISSVSWCMTKYTVYISLNFDVDPKRIDVICVDPITVDLINIVMNM